jgi:hypothetical protein
VAVGGLGVGVAGRRVAVAVGGLRVGVAGRRVGVGGTGVKVGVSVTAGVGGSVGVSVAVGVGVSAAVAVNDGFGVLVGVGVTVGAGAIRDIRGQLQLMVTIIATTIIPRNVRFVLFKSHVLFPWITGHHLRSRCLSSPV